MRKIILFSSFNLIIFSSYLFAPISQNSSSYSSNMTERVNFWKAIYSEYGSNKIVFFDQDNFDLIYYVADLSDIMLGLNHDDEKIKREIYSKIAKDSLRDIKRALEFLNLNKPRSDKNLFGITKIVFNNLQKVKNRKIKNKYAFADNIRYQRGLRERFQEGYELSGRYDGEILARLRAANMPEELIAIAFVESLFYNPARSHRGAAGIWQFLKGTAREFMHVNYLVDERFDPSLATEAAVDYLQDAKEKLGSWPLAITSYNYGRWGMQRAVETVGSTDLEDIIREYEHPRFGFAAKNYYAEVLAALEVYRDAESIFHQASPKPDWQYDLVELPHAVYLRDLIRVKAINKSWFLNHNPALTKRVKTSREVMPPGFKIRVPKGEEPKFLGKIKKISKKNKYKAKRNIRAKHRANGRQTVKDIAELYDIDYQKLADRLGWSPYKKPRKGTVIILRSVDSHFSSVPEI